MGYDRPDPYHQPEDFGLVPVAMIDWLGDEACYEFNMTQIWWKAEEKKFYWATDSGCSCYGPFENHTADDDLESGGFFALAGLLTEWLGASPRPEVAADVADALEAALKFRNAD